MSHHGHNSRIPSTDRVTYPVAGTTEREIRRRLIDRRGEFNQTDRDVLGAVFDMTTTYSKLCDRTNLAKLADLAGIPGTERERRRRVQRSLRNLASIGVRFELVLSSKRHELHVWIELDDEAEEPPHYDDEGDA